MAQFQVFEPNVEVLGQAVLAFLAAFPPDIKFAGEEILGRHGLINASPGDYYRVQTLLDAMKEAFDRLGNQMMFRTGFRFAAEARAPERWSSLDDCWEGVDLAHQMNHRGGHVGKWTYTDEGSTGGLRKVKLVSASHYPCHFDLGLLEGFAKKFRPAGVVDVLIRHDDAQPCRQHGESSCTYRITWG
ncbi:MAG: hypothetical protein AB1646_05210 [Thermodesulfobacteriota bacterium]